MPRSTARQRLSPAALARIPAWLVLLEGGAKPRAVPARLEVLSRHGAVLVVQSRPLPLAQSIVQVALGGPPPLRYMTGLVTNMDDSGPGPFRIGLRDDQPLSPVNFKKLADELTRAL